MLKEISTYVNRFDISSGVEKKLLLQTINSISKSIKILNSAIPEILGGINVAQKMPCLSIRLISLILSICCLQQTGKYPLRGKLVMRSTEQPNIFSIIRSPAQGPWLDVVVFKRAALSATMTIGRLVSTAATVAAPDGVFDGLGNAAGMLSRRIRCR